MISKLATYANRNHIDYAFYNFIYHNSLKKNESGEIE